MAAPTAITRFGTAATTAGIKTRHSIHKSLYGLDKGRQSWVSITANLFATGAAHPDHPSMRITEVDEEMDGDEWNYDISFEGILSGTSKREAGNPTTTRNLDGFDEASDSYITTNKNLIIPGATLEDEASMYCVSVTPTPINPSGLWRVAGRYKGLLGEKEFKRVITVNEQIISPSANIHMNVTGGWATQEKAQISLPKIVVRDTYVGTTPPPTTSIPGANIPPNAPAIAEALAWTGLTMTHHWPHGWKLASIDGHENITGTNIHMFTMVYEYVWALIPN
jgi:hypothetical protein